MTDRTATKLPPISSPSYWPVEKLLRQVGRSTGSWADLGGKPLSKAASLPLQLKPVVASVSWDLLEKLDMSSDQRQELREALLWALPSPVNDKLKSLVPCIVRVPSHRISAADAALYVAANKLKVSTADTTPIAWCNFFTRAEWEKIPPRRRGLLEPMVNDAIRHDSDTGPPLNYTVSYTRKDDIRRAVMTSELAASADMTSWFDQLPMPGCESMMGVEDDEGRQYSLQVAAMGYMPSCKVAQAALGAIDPACPRLALTAKFVDNIAFFGNDNEPENAMALFKARAKRCGAKINDEDNSARTSLDFLGEHYDLLNKTRSLTEKSVKKLARIQEILDRFSGKIEAKMTCRLFMAIIGSLLYCGEVLAVDLSKKTAALRCHAEAAAEAGRLQSWDHKILVGASAVSQLMQWTRECLVNNPVHVTNGRSTPSAEGMNDTSSVTLWVDASAWGWGAVILGSGSSSARHISQPWSDADRHEAERQGGYLASSVFAEPLAVRRALCAVTLRPGQRIEVWSDHLSLVCAAQGGYSLVESYNAAISLLRDIGASLSFIPGASNPADSLSRGQPPLLRVTKIGDAPAAAMYG